MKETLENSLDEEWVDLVISAKVIGLTSVEVEAFINEHQEFKRNPVFLLFKEQIANRY